LGGAELLFGRIAGKLIPPVPQNAATNDGGNAHATVAPKNMSPLRKASLREPEAPHRETVSGKSIGIVAELREARYTVGGRR
jgi:hypothetical protein